MPLSLRPNIDLASFLPLHGGPWCAYNETQGSSPRPSINQHSRPINAAVSPAYGPMLRSSSANLAVKPLAFFNTDQIDTIRVVRAYRYLLIFHLPRFISFFPLPSFFVFLSITSVLVQVSFAVSKRATIDVCSSKHSFILPLV